MATDSLNFAQLSKSNISSGHNVRTYELYQYFSPYELYVEERISKDKPKDSHTNLYDLFDAGINNLSEEKWQITGLSERISSHTQIYCTNNYSTITSNFSSATGSFDEIDYDGLITALSGLDNLNEASIKDKILKWINANVNDFTINQNPENSDESNLILTQALTADIQRITENILNKVFRNLVQLIRFKRDYRMYGPGATIYGNCYKNDISCQRFTAVPASCFTQRSNNYIVGKKAYGDELKNVGNAIQNSVWHISPYNSYALAKHVHSVSIDIGHLETYLELSKDVITGGTYSEAKGCRLVDTADRDNPGTPWDEAAAAAIRGNDPKVCDTTTEGNPVTLNYSGYHRYRWDSNSGNCKLIEKSDWNDNPWSSTEVKLPTYSTRVWVWENDDKANGGTNISSPSAFIDNTI